MTRTGGSLVVLVAVVGTVLVADTGWSQQSPSPDTTDTLTPALHELESGERVRLHLPEREPLDVPFARAASDSLFVGEDTYTASVPLARVERLEVASHPYWKGARLGGAVGVVVGGVIGALSADWSPEVHQDGTTRPAAKAAALAPLVEVTAGIFVGALGGGAGGLLVGATLTDWEQKYPPP